MKNHASGEEKILFLNSEQEKDKTHFMDQETGVELELEENMPLLEWLANNYKNFGAALEIITGTLYITIELEHHGMDAQIKHNLQCRGQNCDNCHILYILES